MWSSKEATELRDIDDSAGEKAILYRIISDGFSELGDDRGAVDSKKMFAYIMKQSCGRFNPVLVQSVLSEYER